MKKRQSFKYFLIAGWHATQNCLILGPIYYYLQQWFHNLTLTLMVCGVILMTVIIRIILRYCNTQYELQEDRVIITTGLLDRVTIDFSDYQGVMSCRKSETWLHKSLNVLELKIAFKNGEDQEDIVLTALPPEVAERIQKAVKRGMFSNETPAQQAVPAVKVTFKKLALTGLLSANCLLVIPLWLDSQQWLSYVNQFVDVGVILQNPIWTTSIGILLLPVINVVYQVINYGCFEVVTDGQIFHIKNGWLNRDAHIITPADIQGLEIKRTVGMRLLKVCTISVILNAKRDEANSKTKNILFPYINEADAATVIQRYLPEYAEISITKKYWQLTYTRGLFVISMGLVGGLIPILCQLPLWTYVIVLIIFGALTVPVWTEIDETQRVMRISRGFFDQKLIILPKCHLGVLGQVSCGKWWQIKTIYTDSKPVHRFKYLK